MNAARAFKIALLYPGDRSARDRADPAQSRFADLFAAFAGAGMQAEPAVYHDDFADEVAQQLKRVDAVLVWCNPIEGGRRRDRLDALLTDVARAGVLVSAHPDTILRLGTKDVLFETRDLPFGSDVVRVDSLDQLASELPQRLRRGARVPKQHRGHSGIGVWRVESVVERSENDDSQNAQSLTPTLSQKERVRTAELAVATSEKIYTGGPAPALLKLRHAQRGSEEERVDMPGLLQRMAPYFEPAHGGHMVDQAWQPRLTAGMLRAYLVEDRVTGFGHQAINALYPAAPGRAAPQPGPRLYHGPETPEFQPLKRRLESGWIDLLRERVGVAHNQLPLLWDCDFLYGEPGTDAASRFVLCEVNVSSVAPFPPSSIAPLVEALKARLAARR